MGLAGKGKEKLTNDVFPHHIGYSHVNVKALRTNIAESTDDLYEFLQQFFAIFEDYQHNDFFIFGESYAGE